MDAETIHAMVKTTVGMAAEIDALTARVAELAETVSAAEHDRNQRGIERDAALGRVAELAAENAELCADRDRLLVERMQRLQSIGGLVELATQAAAERDAMREALAPFAAYARPFSKDSPDCIQLAATVAPPFVAVRPTLGDCRRAAALLAAPDPKEDD